MVVRRQAFPCGTPCFQVHQVRTIILREGIYCSISNSGLFLEFITFLKPLSCILPKVSSGAETNQKLGSTMLKVGWGPHQLERFRPKSLTPFKIEFLHRNNIFELLRVGRIIFVFKPPIFFLFAFMLVCGFRSFTSVFLVQGYFSGFIPRIPRVVPQIFI